MAALLGRGGGKSESQQTQRTQRRKKLKLAAKDRRSTKGASGAALLRWGLSISIIAIHPTVFKLNRLIRNNELQRLRKGGRARTIAMAKRSAREGLRSRCRQRRSSRNASRTRWWMTVARMSEICSIKCDCAGLSSEVRTHGFV
jgi:hypothetical protein